MRICLILVLVSVFLGFGPGSGARQADKNNAMKYYMRMARIVVDPARLDEYKAALRAEMAAGVRKEPGVLNLWAVAEKEHPNHLTIFEVYADQPAYNTHIQTEHFKKYKRAVQGMVTSLELVDVDPVSLESKGKL